MVVSVESLFPKRIFLEFAAENYLLGVVSSSNALAKVKMNLIRKGKSFGWFLDSSLTCHLNAGDLHWKIVSVYINRMGQVGVLHSFEIVLLQNVM